MVVWIEVELTTVRIWNREKGGERIIQRFGFFFPVVWRSGFWRVSR